MQKNIYNQCSKLFLNTIVFLKYFMCSYFAFDKLKYLFHKSCTFGGFLNTPLVILSKKFKLYIISLQHRFLKCLWFI